MGVTGSGSGKVIVTGFGPWGGLVGGGFNLPINQSTKDTTWIQSTNQPKILFGSNQRRLEVNGVTIYNGLERLASQPGGPP